MSSKYNATVIKNDKISDTLFLITVKPDFEIHDFKPGQFTTLGLEIPYKKNDGTEEIKLIKKAYSIASSPIDKNYLEFYIALVPDGLLTPHVFELKPNDKLFVGEKITGKFTLESVDDKKHILMIGTGTGLAPFISMIRTHVICGGDRHFSVLHGARHSYELGYYTELSVMSVNCQNFHYLPAISRPKEDPNWGGLTGRVTEIDIQKILKDKTNMEFSPENFEILLCGNPLMIEDMSVKLQNMGFQLNSKEQKGQIHFEKFW